MNSLTKPLNPGKPSEASKLAAMRAELAAHGIVVEQQLTRTAIAVNGNPDAPVLVEVVT